MKRRIPQQYDFDAMEILAAIRTVCPISYIEVDSKGVIKIDRPNPTPEQMIALRAAIVALLKTSVDEL